MSEIKAIETVYNGYRFRSRLEARWAVFFDSLGIEYEYESEGFFNEDVKYLPDFYLPEFRCLFEVKRGGIFKNGAPDRNWIEKSQDGKKITAITEAIKLKNDDFNWDYLILASGTPYDCCLTDKRDCGLLFNGLIGVMDYTDEKNPQFSPLLEKEGKDMWGHLPVVFEEAVASWGERKIFFGKRSYHDYEETKKYEIIPIGQRCSSLVALMHGVFSRYRGQALFNPPAGDGYIGLDAHTENGPIYKACMAARQARFEHGETPTTGGYRS